MIVGRGDIASALTDKPNYTYFCTGPSNRVPITDRARHDELYKIWNSPREGMFVYVSTLSIYYSDSEYTQHKRRMEDLVKRTFDNHCIIRIGNITWGSNPSTLVNYFKAKIAADEPIEVQDTYRYLVSKEELNHWVNLIPEKGKHEMNVTGTRHKVSEIVEMIKEGKL